MVRTLRLRKLDESQDQHLVELYTLPDAGILGVESLPDQYLFITNRNAHSVHISDHYDPLRGPDHPFFGDPNARPPPVSIYICGEELEGTEHINIDPELTFDGRWVYNLEWLHAQTTIKDFEHSIRMLPGVRRALIYTVPLDDRSDNPKIKKLGRYFNPNFHLEEYPHGAEPEGDMSVLRQRYIRPAEEYTTFKFSSPTFKMIAETGFSAITWDESTGRICIATRKTMKFLIMDVKTIVPPDDRFAQWRRLQTMMNSEA